VHARTTMTTAPRPVRRRRRDWIRARLRGDHEEDGVFRPVRLPLWIDLGIAALIVLVAAGGFVGFFLWLARTQVR
jgi:hypothetical protein